MQPQKSQSKKSKHIKAKSLVTPKKKRASVKVRSDESKSVKKRATKYAELSAPLPGDHDNKKTANKEHKQSKSKAFIDAAVGSKNLVEAVRTLEGAVSYGQGRELMQDPEVQTAIAQRRMTLAEECGITSQKIMREFASMGFSNMKRYAGLLVADSVVTELAAMSDDDAAAIQELTTESYFDEQEGHMVKRVKVKLYPKGDALTKMAQHIGIKGFGGQLQKANDARLGMKTEIDADGKVTVTAVVDHLSDEELERIAMGIEDAEQYSERTE